jgi:ubiquinone/menaquinone biosynthesis C-methylase UbiE
MKPTFESDRDGFQGITWAERSSRGVLGASLDPADKSGHKNVYIDRVHRLALNSALGDKHFNRALDFGCGAGRFIGLLDERSTEVYGVDRTPEMLEIARRSHPLPKNHLLLWRDSRLPFEDRYFDLILSVYVLSVIPRADVAGIICELGRACSPSGTTLMIEQVDHSRQLDLAAYRQFFANAGFDIVSARPIRTSASPFMRLAMNPLLAQFLTETLARAELMRRKNMRFRADTPGYWDYLFVLKKSL